MQIRVWSAPLFHFTFAGPLTCASSVLLSEPFCVEYIKQLGPYFSERQRTRERE